MYKSQSIEHLGLVAGMIEELGITQLIDDLVPQDETQRQLSVGILVKAMVLNGLGFTQRRLYLSEKFFNNKPVELLLGEGVTSEMLNDDALGRALDKIYAYGTSELFSFIAEQAVRRLDLKPSACHDDVTSFHVDGDYPDSVLEDLDEASFVHLKRGYSRDHRPDLKQVALELIVENQASLPVALRVASGETNDKVILKESVSRHVDHLQNLDIKVCVKDSAGYTQASLEQHQKANLHWIMRVPETLTAVKTLKAQADLSSFSELTPGYNYLCLGNNYANVKQRWLLIHSDAASVRSEKALSKRLLTQADKEMTLLKRFAGRSFACREDAEAAFGVIEKELKLIVIPEYQLVTQQHFDQPGRPKKEAVPDRLSYQLDLYPAMDIHSYAHALTRASLFIIATDIVDEAELSDAGVLIDYKNNSKVETGFRFLKDPMFLASTLFLKKVERIIALLMVMTLCLLIYAALQYRIRAVLVEQDLSLPDQKGKPTQHPTAKWCFELFLDVHLLTVANQQLTLNLIPELQSLLSALGQPYQINYPNTS